VVNLWLCTVQLPDNVSLLAHLDFDIKGTRKLTATLVNLHQVAPRVSGHVLLINAHEFVCVEFLFLRFRLSHVLPMERIDALLPLNLVHPLVKLNVGARRRLLLRIKEHGFWQRWTLVLRVLHFGPADRI
jgi:hypothetical protein